MRFPDDVPRLSDGIVTLRSHTGADLAPLVEQASDPLMVRWTTVPVPSSEDSARDFATKVIPDGWERDASWAFAVEAAGDDAAPRFCGTVELRNEGDQRAEIAYGAHPWARGRGLMERGCRLLLDWGFREKRLESVIWWAHAGNWASRRLAWRLGFSCDGMVRQWLPQRGELLDAWVGALLRHDPREARSIWYDVPRVVGDRVVLREFRDADVERIRQACSDARTRYWLHRIPDPYTHEDARQFVENRRESAASGNGVAWAVADPRTDELVANISLFDVHPGRDGEIGYWTHPDARGRGVMTEACGLVVRHAFVPVEDGGLGLRAVRISSAEGNTASRRVIDANGFVLGGREREGIELRDGSFSDALTYDLLASELHVR